MATNAAQGSTGITDLDEEIAAFSGRIGLWAHDLASGAVIEHGADDVFEGASTIKVLIMIEAFRQVAEGRLRLDETLALDPSHQVRGSGVLRDFAPGARLTLHDAIVLMMIVSDNVATNMVIDRVGLAAIERAAERMGLRATRLMAPLHFDRHPPEFGVSRTTGRELGGLVERLARGEAVDPGSDAQMLAIMRRQHYTSALDRYLPYDLLDQSGGRAPAVSIASKSGSWDGVRNIVGLVEGPRFRYVVCLLSADCADERAHPDNEAMVTLPRLSRIVFDRLSAGA